MRYRREIDGLRAIAVIPVIFFHAGFKPFAGGFVGVDVFFVISGYLITAILLENLATNEFSILTFYERRARRILPALFLVILSTLPFAWFLMLPDPFENYAQSVIATILFSNNILLAITSGYWSLASEFKPLLHTWSLGIEEQYYIVAPYLLLASWKFARRWIFWVLAFATVASYILCQIETGRNLVYAFFMTYSRAWELLAGSLVAYVSGRHAFPKRDLPAALGLLLILTAVFTFDQGMAFPGPAALIPTAGTVLVLLYAREGGRVAQLLALRPFVGIGLISYSLYLWHQPLFAFARIGNLQPPEAITYCLLIALAFGLSFLSWKFVETPFRSRSAVGTLALTVSASTVAAALLALSTAIYVSNGVHQRFFDTAKYDPADSYIAYNMRIEDLKGGGFPPSDKPRLLVAGNSQARDFVNMLMETGEAERFTIRYTDQLDPCDAIRESGAATGAFDKADAVIFVTFYMTEACWRGPARQIIDQKRGAVLFVGPKQFGYNLNAFARLPSDERPKAMAHVLDDVVQENRRLAVIVSKPYYLDQLAPFSPSGELLPVFDASGLLISADAIHLTRQGARYFGDVLFHTRTWTDFVARADSATIANSAEPR